MKFQSIKQEILLYIIGVILLTVAILGYAQYSGEMQMTKKMVTERGLIAIKPIVALASRSIEGGNIMMLRNSSALDMYKSYPDLLYLKLSGMSKATPATSFTSAIPSKKIEHIYTKDGASKNMMPLSRLEAMKESEVIDFAAKTLLIKQKMQISNGGTVEAIFSAKEIDSIALTVFKKNAPLWIFVLIVATSLSIFMGNRIATPLNIVEKQIEEITKTLNLTKRVEITTENEIGKVAEWFNALIEHLDSMMGSFSGMVGELNRSSSEIAAAVQQQAAIATEQSTSVSQITATMEELSATSSQIANNSDAVVEISKNALDQSGKGTIILNVLNEKMDEINNENKENLKDILELGDKSKEIGKVMELINSIADQTKLIAFNAAIEASSAGEAGKRFSIVAVEIRRLANSVMESTSEIASKVEEIQSSINRLVVSSEKGTRTINEGSTASNNTLDELIKIVEGTKDTADSSSQISLATQQQKTASAQVLAALKEIDSGARQSSVSIKQTSTITTDLTKLSDKLNNLVSNFKISGNGN